MRHALETMYAFKKSKDYKDLRYNFLIKLVWFEISKIKKIIFFFLIVKLRSLLFNPNQIVY